MSLLVIAILNFTRWHHVCKASALLRIVCATDVSFPFYCSISPDFFLWYLLSLSLPLSLTHTLSLSFSFSLVVFRSHFLAFSHSITRSLSLLLSLISRLFTLFFSPTVTLTLALYHTQITHPHTPTPTHTHSLTHGCRQLGPHLRSA